MGPVEGLLQNAQRIATELDELWNGKEQDGLRTGTVFVIVTKTRPDAAVKALFDAGYRDFGENRIDPFIERCAALPDARFHFIGRLHRKYVAKIVGKTALIHSVASEALLQKIDRSAQAAGCVQPVLLQVNVSGEEQKQGFTPQAIRELFKQQSISLEHVSIRGLMTMAPFTDDEQMVHACFAGLRALRDELLSDQRYQIQNPDGAPFHHLSMGMTNDYRIAVDEGATMVRIGSAVFEGT